MAVEFCLQLEAVNPSEEPNMQADLMKDIQAVTPKDAELQAVSNLVKDGWPTARAEVPEAARAYHTFCECLTLQSEWIYKDDMIVIPQALRSRMLKKIHNSHLGMEGCIRRAKESLFWPGMGAARRG